MKNKKFSWMKLMSFGSWPLTYKLILIFLLTSLIPMGILSYLTLSSSLKQVESDQKENIKLNAISISVQIDSLLDQHRKFAQALAKDPDIISYLSNNQNSQLKELVDNDLDLLTHSLPNISHASLLDINGFYTISSNPRLLGESFSFREYFKEATQGNFFISGLTQGILSAGKGVFFSAPVYSQDDTIIGVVVIKLKVEAIDDIFIKSGFSEYVMRPFLIDENNTIIYHPNEKYRYKKINEIPQLEIKASHNKDKEINNLEFEINNTLFIAGISTVNTKDWHVYVAKPYDEFASPIKKLFHQTLIILFLCSIGSILLAWLLSRNFIRPINLLMQQASDIKEGSYIKNKANQHLLALIQRKDELGDFAKVFQTMVDEIYHREFALDQLVQLRTHELTEKNRLLAESYQRIDQELCLAHDMQQAILPQHFPSEARFQIYANMHPAREMGGDFYDCFALDNDSYAVLVADVAGKGVASAFFMGVSSTIIKQAASLYEAPNEVLACANRLLYERNPSELFVTVFYGVFYPKTARFTYACAGHPTALLRHIDGEVTALEVAHDLPLGAWEEVEYESFTISLMPSDVLLIYSDGITEALSEQNEEFGEVRLTNWLQAHGKQLSAQDIFQSLKKTISHFVNKAQPHDDMTVLLLRMQNNTPTTEPYHWQIIPDFSRISGLAEQVEEVLAPLENQYPTVPFQINLCLDEILNNIIKHGQPPLGSVIDVYLSVDENTVLCRIIDQGLSFNPFVATQPTDTDSPLEHRAVGGLGVHLVKTMMDEYNYIRQNNQNIITLYKHLTTTKKDEYEP